jgi:hypothetical protein
MINTQVYGIYSEVRILCLSCAERRYGNSLGMYLSAGEIQILSDQDRMTYSCKGLLCDDCFNWIFQPEKTKDPWWLVEPDLEEHLRLLAPFADFLETLRIDVMNLRNLSAV